jgi:hypothetical protein
VNTKSKDMHLTNAYWENCLFLIFHDVTSYRLPPFGHFNFDMFVQLLVYVTD